MSEINDNLFKYLCLGIYWLKQPEKTHCGDTTPFNYCIKDIQLYKIFWRLYKRK